MWGSPAGTLVNHNDVTSVRVEGFPSPDAKMMMEVMVRVNGTNQSVDFDY